MKKKAAIGFGNIACGAQGETCNPSLFGAELQAFLKDCNTLAVGLAEVAVCGKWNVENAPPACRGVGAPLELKAEQTWIQAVERPDPFEEIARGLGQGLEQSAPYSFISHVNSVDHSHPKAREEKWNENASSARISQAMKKSQDVYLGEGAFIFTRVERVVGLQLRSAGDDPLADQSDNPLNYLGNRDTEPRAALILHGVEVNQDLRIDIAFCHLETSSDEIRIGPCDQMARSAANQHRRAQIDVLCHYLETSQEGAERPTIILGDFNSRPGCDDLQHLCDRYQFRQVLPENTPLADDKFASVEKTWGQRYDFHARKISPPDYSRSEAEQGWPFTHLRHKTLIDHAFVKGLDPQAWRCQLYVLSFSSAAPAPVSDHNPIVLTIEE